MTGYIKLYRSIQHWRWYTNPNTFRVFVHLLLNVCHQEYEYCEHILKPGQFITCRKKIADELKMTEREVRTALSHLKKTGELTIESTKQYSIITINNWVHYQQNDQQTTNERPINNNVNNVKECITLLVQKENLSERWVELIYKWAKYKESRGQTYKSEESIKALVKKMTKFRDYKMAKRVIEDSMANNYSGLVGGSYSAEIEEKPRGEAYQPFKPVEKREREEVDLAAIRKKIILYANKNND